MKSQSKPSSATEPKVLAHDPLSSDDILLDFYRPSGKVNQQSPSSESKVEKPSHYKIVCLSLYNEDIEKLNQLVAELKKRGHTKANKSQVVRAALEQLDLSKIPNTR